MNQLPPVPAIGLTLAVPKEKVEQAIDQMIAKGRTLLREKASSPEMMEDLKRKNWSWVLETSDALKECFTSESVPLYFASNVYFTPSLKPDDFERDLDEFPYIVGGRLERLAGFRKIAAVVPEPPCGDYLKALFHPKIYHSAWRPFELGQYGGAVYMCVKEIEDHISLSVAGNIQATGVELVRKAFWAGGAEAAGSGLGVEAGAGEAVGAGEGAGAESGLGTGAPLEPGLGLLISPEISASENQAIADLLAGFFGRYKGLPPSAPLSIDKAARAMSLASYLMYTLEAHRVPKKKAEGGEEKPEEAPYVFEFLKD